MSVQRFMSPSVSLLHTNTHKQLQQNIPDNNNQPRGNSGGFHVILKEEGKIRKEEKKKGRGEGAIEWERKEENIRMV